MTEASNRSLLGKAWDSFARKGVLGLGSDVREYLRWRLNHAGVEGRATAPVVQSNWELNQQELRTLPGIVRSKPILVYAEATSRCNLRCFMCRLSFSETTRHKREHMSLSTFARLEPLLEPGSRLSLFGLGEPLLNPNFVEMLRIAKERGAFVGLNSNAMLLTERIGRAMVELEQDLLVISFSGGTRETYERVITGANYDRVIDNVRRLNGLKREHAGGSVPLELAKPVLQLQFTAMKDNLHELALAVRLAVDLRCAAMVVMPLTVFDPSLAEQSILRPELLAQVENAFLAAQEAAATASYPFQLQLPDVRGQLSAISNQQSAISSQRSEVSDQPQASSTQHAARSTQDSSLICYEPWQTFYARDDGTVNTCCYSNRILGDLTKQTALEIWNGELYQRFRARMRSPNKPAECRVCHKLRGDDWYDQRVEDVAFYDEL